MAGGRIVGVRKNSPQTTDAGGGLIWSAVIPAKGGIQAATMALLLCTSPPGLEALGSNESNLPLDSSRHGGTTDH